MIVIDVGPVYARLCGPADQVKFIREAFTLDTPGAEYVKWGDGKTRFLKKGDVFLSGLTWRAIGLLVGAGFQRPIVRWPIIMEKSPLTPDTVSLYDYQESAVQKMLRVRRVGVQSPTGSGKTEIGIEAVRRIGRRTLWLTHRKELMDQTAARFKKLLGIEPGLLGAGKEEGVNAPVVIAMVPTLSRMLSLKTGAPDEIKSWLAGFECVIGDEGHHASAPSWQDVLTACVNANYRYVLSATLDTGNPVNNWKIEGATGPTWVVAGTVELANRGFLAKPHVILLRVPASTYPTYEEIRDYVAPDWRDAPRQLQAMGAVLFRETYERGIMNNTDRNKIVLAVANQHAVAGEKVLVLCSRVPHAGALMDIARDINAAPVMVLDGNCDDTVRSQVLRLFKTTRAGAILFATPFFREGVDLPQIDVGILAGGGLSDTAVTQGLGRVLRPRPDKAEVLWFDFEDGGAETTRADKDYLAIHSASRVALYMSQGFTVTRR
jgi:superfamily II DNA or RNA helicase